MKKTVLIVLAALGINQAIGQTFSVAHDTVTSFIGGTSAEIHNTITNETSSPLVLNWKLVNYSLDMHWTLDGICDNVTCISAISQMQMNNATNALTPSGTMDMKTLFLADSASIGSSSWVSVKVFDPNAQLVSKTITFVAKKVATGVVNVTRSEDDVLLFPNPANDNINVVFPNMQVKSIAVYNLIGKAVKIFKVNGNSAKLDIADVPSGIYFIRLMNDRGQIMATRKFTHQ